MNGKWFTVNVDIVKRFKDENNLDALACYYRMKAVYRNSTLFSVTNQKLEQFFGLSRPTARRYMDLLHENGFIRYHCGNISAVSIGKLSETAQAVNRIRIKLTPTDSIRDIRHKLLFAVFKKFAEQQQYIIGQRAKLDQPRAKIDFRAYKKYIRKGGYLGEGAKPFNPRLVVSGHRLAILLGCSPQSISRIKKAWEELRLVRFTRCYTVLGRIPNGNRFGRYGNSIKDGVPSAFITKRGVVLKTESSEYEIMDEKRWKKPTRSKVVSQRPLPAAL